MNFSNLVQNTDELEKFLSGSDKTLSGKQIKILVRLCIRFNQAKSSRVLYTYIQDNNINLSIDVYNGLLHLNVDDLSFVNNVIEYIKTKSITPTEATYTLHIKSMCTNGQVTSAIKLLINISQIGIKPHTRTYNTLLEHADDISQVHLLWKHMTEYNVQKTLGTYNIILIKLGKLFEIKSVYNYLNSLKQNFDYIDEPLCRTLIQLAGTFNKFTQLVNINGQGLCPHCQSIFKLIPITRKQKNKFMQALTTADPQLKRFNAYLKRDYDVIIDAANVALYGNRPFEFNRIRSVINYYVNNGKFVLVILNRGRRCEISDSLSSRGKVNVYYTPRGVNDDLFWLYATFKSPGTMVVTNDEMADHKYYTIKDKRLFGRWLQQYRIKFSFDRNDTLTLIEPLVYTECIQVINSCWHFPIMSESSDISNWMCLS